MMQKGLKMKKYAKIDNSATITIEFASGAFTAHLPKGGTTKEISQQLKKLSDYVKLIPPLDGFKIEVEMDA